MQSEIEVLSRGGVLGGIIKFSKEFRAEQEHVDDHGDGHDHPESENWGISDVILCNAADDLEGEDHQCRPCHEGRSKETRGHQRMMPIAAASQTDIKESRDGMDAYSPDNRDKNEWDVEHFRGLALAITAVKEISGDVEVQEQIAI